MKLFHREPWYAGGLAFECAQCGRCCAGPDEGYVWVSDAEIALLAKAVGVGQGEFRRQDVRHVGAHMSLIEDKRTNDCIFLTRENGKVGCKVYTARPAQCRAWPFWHANLADVDCWCDAAARCPGINRGSVFGRDEIELRQSWTRA